MNWAIFPDLELLLGPFCFRSPTNMMGFGKLIGPACVWNNDVGWLNLRRRLIFDHFDRQLSLNFGLAFTTDRTPSDTGRTGHTHHFVKASVFE